MPSALRPPCRIVAVGLGALLVLARAPQPVGARPQATAVSPSGAGQNGVDLDQLLARSKIRLEEYRSTFRNLVAEETKVIEVYSASGAVEKRRQIVSDLLVYHSSRDGKETTTEYRDVRSVDGKVVDNRGERALKLLTSAPKATSLEKELEAITRESERHEFKNHLRGLTINQILLPSLQREAFHVELVGREQIAGRDVVVLTYRQTAPIPGSESRLPLPKELRDARILSRGRFWLDAETDELWRSVWELVVPHPATPEPLAMIRSDSTYKPSRFGIPVPDRIVFDWLLRFSHPKNGPPSFALTERTTFTYGAFRRFDVTTDETLGPPGAPAQ